MEEYLKLKKSDCKNCYKCNRNCPVKSIKFSGNQARILPDECILCGMCLLVCPQNAKEVRNDLEKAKVLLKKGKPVYASIAPSFIANFDNVNIKSMEKALKKLGFFKAEETAIGATIVKKCYEDMIKEGTQNVIISSCCPTVNMLIQKYYPQALPYLAHIMSPMQAHCSKIKRENPDALTVFIGPCISKKAEADRYDGIVDCALTFEELSEWLESENIELENAEDDSTKGRARLFPTNGGILRSMDCDNKKFNYMSVDGILNCVEAIKDIISGEITNCFIEMSACFGSCVGGPAMNKEHRLPVRDYIAVHNYSGDKDFEIEMPKKQDILKDMENFDLNIKTPPESEIQEILHNMGKTSKDQELNCGSCGYNSCREKAIAVYYGKADMTMCMPFLKEKAESFADIVVNSSPNAIIILNEDLEVQRINLEAQKLMNIQDPNDVVGETVVRVLNPYIFFQVLTKNQNIYNQKEYLSEYKKYVEITVVHDKKYHMLICVFHDITEVENTRIKKEALTTNAIEITDKVIDKQMRVVQDIASLLGETTAETKIALTKLKESLRDE